MTADEIQRLRELHSHWSVYLPHLDRVDFNEFPRAAHAALPSLLDEVERLKAKLLEVGSWVATAVAESDALRAENEAIALNARNQEQDDAEKYDALRAEISRRCEQQRWLTSQHDALRAENERLRLDAEDLACRLQEID